MNSLAHHNSKTLVLINNSHKGDFNNIYALATAIKAAYPDDDILTLDLNFRTPLLLPLYKLLFAHSGLFREKWLSYLFFKGDVNAALNLNNTRYIFSTLGSGEAASTLLKYVTSSKNIHLGHPKRISDEHFDYIISHQGDVSAPREINLPYAPSRFLLKDCQNREELLFMIGGNANNIITYNEAYWKSVFNALQHLSHHFDKKWTLITAPRTPPEILKKLQDVSSQTDIIKEIVLFNANVPTDLEHYIYKSEHILVTGESVSMIGDAIASGAKTYAVIPNIDAYNTRINTYIKKQSDLGVLSLISQKQLDAPKDWTPPKPISRCWSEYFKEKIYAANT